MIPAGGSGGDSMVAGRSVASVHHRGHGPSTTIETRAMMQRLDPAASDPAAGPHRRIAR